MKSLLYALLLAVAAFAFTKVEKNTAAPDGAVSVAAVQAEVPVLPADALTAVNQQPIYVEAAHMMADRAADRTTLAEKDNPLTTDSASEYCLLTANNANLAVNPGRAFNALNFQRRRNGLTVFAATWFRLGADNRLEGRAHAPSIVSGVSERRIL